MNSQQEYFFRFINIVLVFVLFQSCNGQTSSTSSSLSSGNQKDLINPEGKILVTRINLPEGFERINEDSNSFAFYLRNLPLKPDGSKVHLFDGTLKQNTSAYCAVVDMDVGNTDLQQCADAVMRLRAEYLFAQKKFDQIHFNFTSGDQCDFVKYAEGYRASINGNNVSWVKTSSQDYSYRNFRNYLNLVFNYAGSLSLSRELKPVSDWKNIQPGDVIILGGTPGHAVTVVDVAINSRTSEKYFMIAQSYMPAQEIQILVNESDSKISPWYSIAFGDRLITPEYIFTKDDLMRF